MRACDGKFSEDAYYEMCLQDRYEQEYEKYYHTPSHSKQTKQRLNRYARKQICKTKLDRLHNVGNWWTVWDKGTHKVRCYISPRAKHYKKHSNKKVRKTKSIGNHGNYRKVYDFWWKVW